VYLRESRRRNKDGTVVSYLQLAHNERHPRTGSPVAKVIHNFGRADLVDRAALRRLVASISRFLEPGQAVTAAAAGGVEVLDSRRMGGAWVQSRLWERLEIGQAIRCAAEGRRLDGEAAGRVIFALAAQRALEPASKLAATGWVAGRVFIEGCPGFSDDAAYRAMDFLPGALEEIASEIFFSVAHLLNLDVGIVFVDTTSAYWEMEVAAELAEVAGEDDDQDSLPGEAGARLFGHAKGPPRRPAAGGDRDGGHPGRDPGAVLDRPRRHARSEDRPQGEGRPGRVEPAAAGAGRRPRVRLRRQPRLPGPRRRALHPRREAAEHQCRGGGRAGPSRPLPRCRREPAGQGGAGAGPGRRGEGGAVRGLP